MDSSMGGPYSLLRGKVGAKLPFYSQAVSVVTLIGQFKAVLSFAQDV